jgi:RNA polymerase sigma-B factor
MATSLSQPASEASLGDSLWQEYQRTRDPRLREQLLEQHAGLVIHAARQLASNPDTVEDLIQEGYLGLLRAIDSFDPARGVTFATFAYPAVSGAMRNYLRDRGSLIREPESMRALRGRVSQAAVALAERGQSPTVERLAQQVGTGEGAVRRALRARPAFCPVSSGEGSSDDQGDGRPRGGQELSVPDDFASEVPDRLLMAQALRYLSPTERAVIEQFFYEDLTQREIARALGRSCSNVSRALRRALDKLRSLILRAEQEQGRAAADRASHPPEIRPAIVDPETGLFCRAHFHRCLSRALRGEREEEEPLCLVLMKLDGVIGNRSIRALTWLSAQVRQNTRAADLAFRIGRWRLALLLDEPRPQGSAVCRRVADLARRRAHPVAVSVGLAEWPSDGRSPAELLLSARRALSQARPAAGG